MSKTALFFSGHKGGSGTTLAASLVLGMLREEGRRVAAYDGDSDNGRLARYYGTYSDGVLEDIQDPLVGVRYFDILDDKQRDVVLDAAEMDADVVLFDLPSGTISELGLILGGRDDVSGVMDAFIVGGFEVTIVNVITPEFESVGSVADSLDLFADSVRYVVVENHRNGEDADDFGWWHGTAANLEGVSMGGKSKARIEAHIAKDRAAIFMLPALKASTMQIANINGVALDKLSSDKRIPIADRSRIFRWLMAAKNAVGDRGGASVHARKLLGFVETKNER